MGTQQRFHRRLDAATVLVAFAVAAAASTALGAGTARAAATELVVKPPKGAARPVPSTGIGTRAALDDPRCRTGEQFSVYGHWDSSVIGGGPLCVRPFKKGDNNGGATARGVTKDKVKVVAVLPSPARGDAQAAAAPPIHRDDNSRSTWADMVHDYLMAYAPFYETWGRDIEVVLHESTGTDETAQRADAVAIEAEKPFAVINFDTFGLDTLVTALAQNKIVVHSYAASPEETSAQAPYRWGGNDPDAAAVNTAEVIGKQLVGKKAVYAGSAELKSKTRTFGLVTIQDQIDETRFTRLLGKYGARTATKSSYIGSGGALGDAEISQREAPVMVTRMKDAGVTTVVLFTDVAMNTALMTQATAQDWYPEWFVTGSGYYDLAVLAQAYPDKQAEHTFGISIIGPYFEVPPDVAAIAGPSGAYNWYWGEGVGTTSGVAGSGVTWLLNGIHHAGPKLTPHTFKQGLWAMPATGGSATNSVLQPLTGYGHTTGLPYAAYIPGPGDFAPMWMDPYTRGISPGVNIEVNHVSWYIDGGRRYAAGKWPKNLAWFDKSKSIKQLDEWPPALPMPQRAAPCAPGRCPATGATTPTAGTQNQSRFVVRASDGAGASS